MKELLLSVMKWAFYNFVSCEHPRPHRASVSEEKKKLPTQSARGFAQVGFSFTQIFESRVQFGVAFDQVACDVIKHSQRLAQHEQVLLTPVAGQRFGL